MILTEFIQPYIYTILSDLSVLPGFIIVVQNFNNIRFADVTVSKADTEWETTRTPTECSEGNGEERTKNQLQENTIYIY